jgi:hypothetical protein
MMSTGPRQPSLGWSDVRSHASNHVPITVVTQGAVGLVKSRTPAGRERRRLAGRVTAAVGRMILYRIYFSATLPSYLFSFTSSRKLVGLHRFDLRLAGEFRFTE